MSNHVRDAGTNINLLAPEVVKSCSTAARFASSFASAGMEVGKWYQTPGGEVTHILHKNSS